MPESSLQFAPIFQRVLSFRPWERSGGMRLPGLAPLAPDEWVMADDAFAAQTALRGRLVREQAGAVIGVCPGADDAVAELCETLGAEGTGGDAQAALAGLAERFQEDFAILQAGADGAHVMRAGLICFPALWTLSQKLGRTLGALHGPVPAFDAGMTARVERVFASLRPETALVRGNVLIYTDWRLHQPAPEGAAKVLEPGRERLVRIERQTLRRLPVTGALVFAIHTVLMPVRALEPEDRAALIALRPEAAADAVSG